MLCFPFFSNVRSIAFTFKIGFRSTYFLCLFLGLFFFLFSVVGCVFFLHVFFFLFFFFGGGW